MSRIFLLIGPPASGKRTPHEEVRQQPPPADALRIDTARLSSRDAARLIAAHSGALR